VEFVNWMSADDMVAFGQLQGGAVTLAGRLGTGSVVDGSCPLFSGPAFTPALPNSDAVNVVAVNGNRFTVMFTASVQDPLFHLASFGSRLDFPAGTAVEKVSGDDSMTVSGSTVTWDPHSPADANGTVRVPGVFRSLTFSLTPNFTGGSGVDGIYLQLGGVTPASRQAG
jgi:hypothetical protein